MTDSTLKIAIIGTDTSHSIYYSRYINDTTDPRYVPGARVVAAVPDPYGSIEGCGPKAIKNAAEIESRYGVQLVETYAELPEDIDAFFILGTDGSRHLAQFRECAERGKPVFIDKPLVLSLEEAQTIQRIAQEKGVPVMSTSSLRFADEFLAALAAGNGEPVTGADCFGYMELMESAPGYFWYGIHSVEMLIAAMGTGVQDVTIIHQEQTDTLVGVWEDGRIGTIRGSRQPHYMFGGTIHTAAGPAAYAVVEDPEPAYHNLVKHLVQFVQTGVAPFDFAQTIDVIRFLELAETRRQAELVA